MDDDARTKNIFSILSHTYPDAKIALSYKSPWELLVAVILSAQCTDTQVNIVTEKLFKKYPTFDSYIYANIKEFEQDIRSTGFFHNKAKNILNAALVIQKIFKGEVPKTMNDLLTLPGVARKTANVVLGNAFGVVEGIAVDTHVIRLSQRLRLVPMEKIGGRKAFMVKQSTALKSHNTTIDYYKDASPVKIESELMKVVPKKDWFSLTYRLIDHGRAMCKAMRPRCDQCPLSGYCPANTFKQNDS